MRVLNGSIEVLSGHVAKIGHQPVDLNAQTVECLHGRFAAL
jgi:hypothetical protein